jgi:enoyl-CoA hydratase/carnithine racemase
MADTVLTDRDGPVTTLTLNRPERLNAITPELARQVREALVEANADDAVRVIRLRGAGRTFCAGYDIGWGSEWMVQAEGDRPWDPMADLRNMNGFVQETYMALWRSPKPVIAQVHGFCVGGGTDFALCSDLIVCSEDCRIGYPPARVWGSPTTAMWTYRLGLERSKRLLLTGDALDGRRAVEWGLASESHSEDELDAAALALAEHGADLLVCDRDEAGAAETARLGAHRLGEPALRLLAGGHGHHRPPGFITRATVSIARLAVDLTVPREIPVASAISDSLSPP